MKDWDNHEVITTRTAEEYDEIRGMLDALLSVNPSNYARPESGYKELLVKLPRWKNDPNINFITIVGNYYDRFKKAENIDKYDNFIEILNLGLDYEETSVLLNRLL